jgi:hypothetical protein
MRPPARQIGQSEEINLLWKISQKIDEMINKLCCTTTSTTTSIPTTTTTTTEEITTTTTTTAEPFFMMKFDTLANASLTVGGDATDVADWNTFFDLPANGTPFDNIQIVGTAPTEITLYGGGNMTIIDYLFGDNDPNGTSLLEIEDNGVTIECGNGVFSDNNIGWGCYNVTKIHFPDCITLDEAVFTNCESLVDLLLPFDSYTELKTYVFKGCISLEFPDFINLTSAGTATFRSCTNLRCNFPSLITAGNTCFYLSGLVNPIFANLVSVAYGCFHTCTELTSLGIPICTDLGGTTGDDDVFAAISGKTITITVPSSLMTCNAGQPDGDIQELVANNTVTIIQI